MTKAVTLANLASGEALTIDETNDRIGIASTAPSASVDVNQSILLDGNSGVVTATSFSGNLTGNVTGNTSGTAGGLTGTPSITVRDIVAVGATFSGVLTYEDVTQVDSVGLITARTGVNVTAGGINVTAGGITVQAGIATLPANSTIGGKIPASTGKAIAMAMVFG